jgi:hypothetical protein
MPEWLFCLKQMNDRQEIVFSQENQLRSFFCQELKNLSIHLYVKLVGDVLYEEN